MVELTLGELAAVLQPPMTERQLRAVIAALDIQPSGRRRTGRRGRPHATYDATQLLKLHAALMPFLNIHHA